MLALLWHIVHVDYVDKVSGRLLVYLARCICGLHLLFCALLISFLLLSGLPPRLIRRCAESGMACEIPIENGSGFFLLRAVHPKPGKPHVHGEFFIVSFDGLCLYAF